MKLSLKICAYYAYYYLFYNEIMHVVLNKITMSCSLISVYLEQFSFKKPNVTFTAQFHIWQIQVSNI